jgi:hypothetical protein
VASTYLVTGYEAYVREIDEPLTTKFRQTLVLYAKSTLNSQGTYDLGSYVAGSLGTFWTAAIADTTAVAANPAQGILTATTAGAIATAALGVMQNVAGVLAENFLRVESPYLVGLQKISGSQVLQFTSAAYGGGSATPTVTVTGLLSTDTIVSVTQAAKNSNNLPLIGFGAVGAGTLGLIYSADPGTTGTVSVGVLRSTGLAPQTSQYTLSLSNMAPQITFSATGAPTTTQAFFLEWDLSPGNHGVKSPIAYF